MIEIDILKVARSLVDAHGWDVAWQHAAAKAFESASDGEVGIVWLRIIDAIDNITRTKRQQSELVN